jgi:hypothetical protein
MHEKAKEWDLIHNAHTVNSRYVCGWIPHNRPCDMCGEPVPEGFIHHACLRKELEDGYERPHLHLREKS